MTYDEIVKSLEVCQGRFSSYYCQQCPLFGKNDCIRVLIKESLALFKRQRNRVNRLADNLDAVLKERASLDVDKIIEQLKEVAFQEDAPIYKGDIEIDSWLRLSKAIEIVEGGAE